MSTATGRLNWPFAAAWTVCTMVGWLGAVALAEPRSYSPLTLWAVFFAQFVTLALRWPLISRQLRVTEPGPSEQSHAESQARWLQVAAQRDHELTWILCWNSQLYVLGAMLLGDGLSTTLVLAMMVAISEILLLRWAPLEWRPWLIRWLPEDLLPRPSGGWPITSAALWEPDEPTDFNYQEESRFDGDDEGDVESAFESSKFSATFHGQAEDGQPYLQGWQRYEMAPGQKSISLLIGFFPPFPVPPECQLDHEGDESVSCELEHITPAGARITLRRRQTTDSLAGKLLWHCSA